MSELSGAAPGGAAVPERDVLLATKLHVPRPQPGFVPRPRLAGALDEGLAQRLILVCAPAGFGKTALLAAWARRGGRPVGWLSLDAGDNDPARFWRHVVAALDRIRPGIGERAGPLLGPPAPPSFEGLVTALINELAAGPGDDEVVLVLDDYHVIDTQQVHQSLQFLLEHLPPGLHLVLATRSDPPLPLARLRAGGQLAEIRAGDLRFTAEEAAALLREAVGGEVPGAMVAALAARTEGWAAGLQLAGLSLRGQPDMAGFVASFSGTHRYVLDYLAGEVLEGQTERVREFLLQTSVLERLSGELCDAVTGHSDSQAMLEQVDRANLFLVSLDEVRGWWRYHHLFADLLRARLQQQQPGRVRELHRAAAAWYQEHGSADDAVRHALAAGDVAWAARLIEQHFDALLLLGERATIQRWLAALPGELAQSRPRLLLAQTWMALLGGDVAGAAAPLDAAERASAAAADEIFEPSVGTAGSRLANVPAAIALARAFLVHLHGDAEGTVRYASRALAEINEGEWLQASEARWQMAVAEWLRGHLEEADRAFAAVIARCREAGDRGLAAASCHLLGQVQQARGRLDVSLGTYQQTLEITAPPSRPALGAAGIAYVGMAEVAYQRNDLDAALRHVSEGVAACRQITYTQPLARGLTTLARIQQARGDPAGALAAIGEAERAEPDPAVPGLLNPVPAHRARLLLAQGDVAEAAGWAHERGLDAGDDPGYPWELEYLVLARVLLARDLPGPAVALLERLHVTAAAQGRAGSIIEIQALQALAFAAAGDEDAAVGALAGALTLACPQGYVRVFVDEGPPMRALLTRLVAAQKADRGAARAVPLGCVARVISAFGETLDEAVGGSATAAPVPGLVDQLTPRELEVLTLLAAGSPNPRIAQELVVTLDTVKKHVGHLLGKLGAANRTEAVARARQLGLIP
ncbi:MAG: helix-turn-helix transcriptional regulator [Actinobacteria bacterium]|nr:helix-turn-helix transcriptional regulator [Actinomycetota bacterium]